jgi:hypothetical protein
MEFWYMEFWVAEAWPGLVNRDDVVGAGHTAISNDQFNTAVAQPSRPAMSKAPTRWRTA